MPGLQSILFDKNKFSKSEARAWMVKHNLKPIKGVHETVNLYRYRLAPPVKNGNYRYIHITKGVSSIYMY